MLPSLSTTERYVVPLSVPGGMPAGTSQSAFDCVDQLGARGGEFLRPEALDRDLGESRIGVVADHVRVGDLLASIIACSALAELWPICASGKRSMMLSISSAAMPCPFGGSS